MVHHGKPSRTGRVPRDLVPIETIAEQTIWFAAPASAGSRQGSRERRPRAVAVLEVNGTNFALLNVDEQLALVENYRSLVRGLSPGTTLQVLVRREAADLSGYLALLAAREQEETLPAIYRHLARAHREHLLTLVGSTFFRSRFYVVLAQQENSSRARHAGLLRWFGPVARQGETASQTGRRVVLMQLASRCKQIVDRFSEGGLEARRLSDQELAEVCASCLAPGTPTRLPTTRALVGVGVDLPLFTRSADRSDRSADGRTGRVFPVAETHAALSVTHAGNTHRAHPRRFFPSLAQARSRAEAPGTGLDLPPRLMATTADLLAPGGIEERPDSLCVDGVYLRNLVITAFPREVHTGWLLPLLSHEGTIDVSFHLRGLDPVAILRKYRRRKAELQASKKLARKKGWVENPDDAVAETDVERLLRQVAERSELLIEVGIQIQVRAATLAALDEQTNRVMETLRGLLLVAHVATFEQIPAWQSMQPWNDERLGRRLVLDTASLADGFPFVSNTLTMPGGALAGVSQTGEPVFLDYWSEQFDNPHCFLGAITGAGKSYDRKVNFLRQALIHPEEQILIIDPEGEYERICHALGGTLVRLAAGSAQHLNPFDLVPPGVSLADYQADRSHGDRLAENVVWLGTLYNLMLSNWGSSGAIPLAPDEKGLLEHATFEAYRRHGFTSHDSTHGNVPPTLREIYQIIQEGTVGQDTFGLSHRLYRFVEGSLAGIFAPSNVRLDGRLIVFDVRAMTGDLRPIGIYLIANFLWGQVLADQSRPRALYIDEAWSLIQHPEGGAFLEDFARRARKRYLRLVTITQSPELFLADPHGAAIAGNAAIKILKKQDRTTVAAVGQRFGLTRPQQHQLGRLQKPESLLLAGGMHLLLTLETNPLEHRLATSDPRELARLAAEEAQVESADPTVATNTEPDAEPAAEEPVAREPAPAARPSRRMQTVPLPRLAPLDVGDDGTNGPNGRHGTAITGKN